jgi:hypothetical protein
MRFFLLARARSTGLIRLLSERAFDSRSAAVDAAGATAGRIDLSDDEVLAVDLDAAGPVLVLRLPAPPAVALVPAEPAFAPPTGLFAPASSPAPAFGGSPFDEELPDSGTAASASAVRLQPRFPLFGAEDDALEEDLAETLRLVARRMEADLTPLDRAEWVAADDSWDARTLDDYAFPDDTHLHGAREEGRLRIDAAERLRDDEAAPDEMDDRRLRDDRETRLVTDAPPEADLRRDDGPRRADVAFDDGGDAVARWDPLPDAFDDARDARANGPEGWTFAVDTIDGADATDAVDAADRADDVDAVLADDFAADDRTLDLLPEEPQETLADDDLAEPAGDEMLPAEYDDASEVLDAGPALDTARFYTELIPRPPSYDPEPPPYRPANIDFAMWVCADCVYQRTCRKAGIATPSTCGNFQWRSF